VKSGLLAVSDVSTCSTSWYSQCPPAGTTLYPTRAEHYFAAVCLRDTAVVPSVRGGASTSAVPQPEFFQVLRSASGGPISINPDHIGVEQLRRACLSFFSTPDEASDPQKPAKIPVRASWENKNGKAREA